MQAAEEDTELSPTLQTEKTQALLTEAEALLESYTGWQETLPESLKGSEKAVKIQDTVRALEQVVELLSGIEAPKGFGRD